MLVDGIEMLLVPDEVLPFLVQADKDKVSKPAANRANSLFVIEYSIL